MLHWKDFLDAGARGGRYLPWKEVGRVTGLSRTTAWRLPKRGDFPTPYAISPGRVGCREDEVEAWRVSRDHSATRPRSAADIVRDSPVASDPPFGSRRQDVTRQANPARAPPEVATTPAASPMAVQPALRRAGADLASKRAKTGRRRSQHSQAIAQQILFDF